MEPVVQTYEQLCLANSLGQLRRHLGEMESQAQDLVKLLERNERRLKYSIPIEEDLELLVEVINETILQVSLVGKARSGVAKHLSSVMLELANFAKRGCNDVMFRTKAEELVASYNALCIWNGGGFPAVFLCPSSKANARTLTIREDFGWSSSVHVDVQWKERDGLTNITATT